jgi:uncharacterized membrane protein YqiK
MTEQNVTILLWSVAIGIPLLLIIFWRTTFRIFGIVVVPENKIGLVTKNFKLFGANKTLPDGRIIATQGEAGFQAQLLAPGLYFGYWFWQYQVTNSPLTIVPPGKIGLIVARDGRELPIGNILARSVECDLFQDAVAFLNKNGQKGRQTSYLTSGTYRINTILFEVVIEEQTVISDNRVGIVTTLDGLPIEDGQIAGKQVEGHNNFQNVDAFLAIGGNKGRQPQVILAGSYNLNPWFLHVEQVVMTEIPIGHVGVVISFYGQDGVDVSGIEFKHGNIVAKGYKGVWAEPLGPGKYPINTFLMKVEIVPTTNLVLNWATGRNESHNLDRHLSTITVRSKDGFPFNLDVSQIIHIPATEAPKVIARFGSMMNLVSQVLEPTIGNYFRNSAQNADVISFLSSRKERQQEAREHINEVLDHYNVEGVDTLIGDIVPPDSLMKTLTDRKIAEEQKVTFDMQKKAQETRQLLEKETAIAEMQREIVKADQGVLISHRTADALVKKAEGDAQSVRIQANAEGERMKLIAQGEAEKVRLLAIADSERLKMMAQGEAELIKQTGDAEAQKIMSIGKSNAEAYRLAVEAMGGDNFSRLKVTEAIGREGIKVIPDVLITGNGGDNGPISGLLGLKLMEMLSEAPEKGKKGKGNGNDLPQLPDLPIIQ